jgi:3-deoxy-D-manno-octulosonic-acid transferase
MLWPERIYELGLRASRGLLRSGWSRPAIARAVAGRRAALPHLAARAASSRTASPLLLVHAPSVGEALMAQAIIGALRQRRPDLQLVFTFFSPSAERTAPQVGADVWCYLPWDIHADCESLLDTLRPAAIAFIRTEIWPVLTAAAAARGCPALLLNAVLGEHSSRLGAGARLLLGAGYRRLRAVGAVAADDARRFHRLGVAGARVHVTGDARFDQVWQRISALDRASPLLLHLREERPTLVAGSTWPADEAEIALALAGLDPADRPRLVLAPHQPSEEHLLGAERTLAAAGLPIHRLAAVERGEAAGDVLVDRVGVLADLYALADLAYVGGGFGTAGLHSVVEPAALGVPVLFGPRHGNAREAGELAGAGGGRVVRTGELAGALEQLLRNDGARLAAGERALAFVRSRLGGAAANADLLLSVL